jgi:hypothetical protein
MLVKASIFATAAICAVVTLSQVDYRQLYDGMYPVNGLRRDVLTLCHRAEPTFIRAIEADRTGCYDGMPDPVERAIGWVRTSSRLAAMRRPTPVEMAERMLVVAAAENRIDRLAEPRFTGYAALQTASLRPCEPAPKGLQAIASTLDLSLASREDRALGVVNGEPDALTALGLPPRVARVAKTRQPDLPVLSLGGAGDTAAPAPARVAVSTSLGPALGADSDTLPLLPVAAAGCKTPA